MTLTPLIMLGIVILAFSLGAVIARFVQQPSVFLCGSNIIQGVSVIGGVYVLGTAGDYLWFAALGFITVILGVFNILSSAVTAERLHRNKKDQS